MTADTERHTKTEGPKRAGQVRGVYLPVTTPFDEEDGVPDLDAFRRNLGAWLDHGVAGIVVAGSTGEAPLLDDRELWALVDAAREEIPKGRELVVGTGAESTRRTVSRCREVGARGADAVLVRPPAYYADAMSHAALKRHYRTVADESPVPVFLYHIPRYVPVDLEPELVEELAAHENVTALKDSSGDVKRLGTYVETAGDDLDVLVGSGTLLYGGLEVGAAGGIVAVGNVATGLCCELERAWREGDSQRAGALQERIGPLHRKVVGRHGVPGVKHALDVLGLDGGPPRPPFLPLEAGGREDVERALEAAGVEA